MQRKNKIWNAFLAGNTAIQTAEMCKIHRTTADRWFKRYRTELFKTLHDPKEVDAFLQKNAILGYYQETFLWSKGIGITCSSLFDGITPNTSECVYLFKTNFGFIILPKSAVNIDKYTIPILAPKIANDEIKSFLEECRHFRERFHGTTIEMAHLIISEIMWRYNNNKLYPPQKNKTCKKAK